MHDQYKSCRYLRRGVELKQEKNLNPFELRLW
jgi:hypothetical protein